MVVPVDGSGESCSRQSTWLQLSSFMAVSTVWILQLSSLTAVSTVDWMPLHKSTSIFKAHTSPFQTMVTSNRAIFVKV